MTLIGQLNISPSQARQLATTTWASLRANLNRCIFLEPNTPQLSKKDSKMKTEKKFVGHYSFEILCREEWKSFRVLDPTSQ